MIDISKQTFSAGEVIAAADITMSTLQNWLRRGVIVGHRKIEGGGERGRHRRFSWFNVMEICTAAALVRAGVTDLTVAFAAGMRFGHTAPGSLPGTPARTPSLPFRRDQGRTLLIVAGERSKVVLWEPGQDALTAALFALQRPEAFVVVDLLQMFERACAALDLNAQEVMDRAPQLESDS